MASEETPQALAGPTGKVERAEEETVTPLELFFDLVFVLSFTQVTATMAQDPTWAGLGEGMLILAVVWWAWVGYSWLTNAVDPNEDLNRFAVFTAMAGMLIVSIAIPGTFGDEALLFGIAFFVVRAIHVFLFARAGRQDEGDLLAGVLRMAPAWLFGAALILVAAAFDGTARAAIWIAALIVDYGGTALAGGRGYRVHPSHFAERHGLILIIALGESIVAIGAGAGFGVSGLEVVAAIISIVLAAALWWAYFDVAAIIAERRLAEAPEEERPAIARDAYSYLHLPMIAGIVLLALGIKKTLGAVEEPLKTIPALALCAGPGLFLLGHVAFRYRNVRTLAAERLATGVLCFALVPLALEVDSVIALGAVSGLVTAHIAHRAFHSREARARLLADPSRPLAELRGRDLR